jgi:uncharacterized Tic20 family protein
MSDKDQQNWAGFIHLSILTGFIIPFGSFIAPLILWAIKRSESEVIDKHGKEAVNFQLSLLLYAVIVGIILFSSVGWGIFTHSQQNHYLLDAKPFFNVEIVMGGVILFALFYYVVPFILAIIASVKAFNGGSYRYPFSIRFIR